MTKTHYTIDYWFDEEDSELHLTIYQGEKAVHAEDIVRDFEDEEDKKLTCLEAAQRHGFFPALFQEDYVKKAMSELGKRSFAKRSQDTKKMSEWGRKAAAARWEEHKNTSK